MYKVRYWVTGRLRSKMFETMHDAVMFSVYTAPFQSIHAIDKVD